MNAYLIDEVVVAELRLEDASRPKRTAALSEFLRRFSRAIFDRCDIRLTQPAPYTRRCQLEFLQTSHDVRWRLDVHVLTPDLLSTEPIVRLAAWVVSPLTPDGQRPVTMNVRAFHEAWDRLRPDLAICLTNAVRTTAGRLTLIYPPASTAVT